MKPIPIRHINGTLKEPAFSESFDIVDIHQYLSGKIMIQELHRHSFYYVLVLEKGSGEHRIDFETYMIQDYCLFFMRPGQVHEIVISSESTGYLLKFSKDFYAPTEASSKQVLRKISNKNFWVLEEGKMKEILLILSNIFRENNAQQERYLETIQAYLSVFFIALLRQREAKDLENSHHDYMQERLEEFHELIRISATQHKQLSYYSQQLNLTPYQLNAITKTTLGKTSREVIIDYLILEAKRNLLASSNQVSQIAWHLGYEDVSYFVRFFKKHTGYSPEAFRKNFKL
ncbi:helix-turn-helix transcriptional regulator [Pedobacter gandavensis]|uniref:helix-turn-helix domain-containing protein n=1 Tax=Pedobacter gandavensis TaxID=2679963 RepID=UPI00292DC1AD|nr:helix-turn-helix transcriptional regulator [Pedobacter gandavensis]